MIMRLTALLALAATAPVAPAALAQDSVPWPAADRLQAVVQVRVDSLGPTLFRVAYAISSLPASEQSARGFVVRAPVPISEVTAPTLWSGIATMVGDSAAVHWYPLTRQQMLAPGTERDGFAFVAAGLPGVVSYRLKGHAEPPEVEEGVPVASAPPIWANAAAGVTVGIEALPADQSPGALVTRLRELTDAACALEWLGSTDCAALRDEADAAAQALAAGQTGAARTGVQAFRARADGLDDRSAGLLVPNADFALARLDSGGTPTTLTLAPAADTYIRSGNPNQNQGTEAILRVRPDGDNRALIRFDQAAVAAAVGSRTVSGAQLELTIAENFDNWGPSGRTLDLHRLTRSWTETGATWNCGDDLEPGDPNPDCPSTAWAMDGPGALPWVSATTAVVLMSNGMRGVVTLDVTADVAAWLDGTGGNFGWLLKRTDEGPSGAVDFASRESVAGVRLVVTVQ